MKKINNRLISVLQYLKNHEYVSSSLLAKEFDVSPRTIKRYIKTLKSLISDNGAIIDSQKKHGHKLVILDRDKYSQYLLKLGTPNNIEKISLSYKHNILYLLLFSNTYLKIEDIEETLYLSKGTITSILNELKIDLACFDIEIKYDRKNGFFIINNELGFRLLLLELLSFNYHFKPKQRNYPNEFCSYFDDFQFKIKKQKIIDLLNKYNIDIYHIYIDKLINYFSLTNKRINDNHLIDIDLSNLCLLNQTNEYLCAKHIVNSLSNVKWNKYEILILAVLIISCESINFERYKEHCNYYVNKCDLICKNVINALNIHYGVDFNNENFVKPLHCFLYSLIIANDFHLAKNISLSRTRRIDHYVNDPLAREITKFVQSYLLNNYQYTMSLQQIRHLLLIVVDFLSQLTYPINKINLFVSTCLPKDNYLSIEKYIKKYNAYIDKYYIGILYNYKKHIDKVDVILTEMAYIEGYNIDKPIFYYKNNPLNSLNESLKEVCLLSLDIKDIALKFSEITHLYDTFPYKNISDASYALRNEHSTNESLTNLTYHFDVDKYFPNENVNIDFMFLPYQNNKEFINIYKSISNNKNNYDSKKSSYVIIVCINIDGKPKILKALQSILSTFNYDTKTIQNLYENDYFHTYINILYNCYLI